MINFPEFKYLNVVISALLALTEYGKGFEVQNRNTDMSVQYEFLNTVRRMKVTSAAATTLHKRILPGETRQVGIRATGSGVSVIEVGFQYNLNVTAAWPSFVVNPFVTKVRSEVDLKQNLLYGLLFPGLHC